MYAFESDMKALAARVERIEELLNLAADDPEFEQELAVMMCQKLGHKYVRISYDLQGGKWGKERCERCGDKYSWSV